MLCRAAVASLRRASASGCVLRSFSSSPAPPPQEVKWTVGLESGREEERPRGVFVNRPRPRWNALKCTQCLECVSACDQSALFPAWLPTEKVERAREEGDVINSVPASDMPGTEFTFFITKECNGCSDCANRCDELFYGGCLDMVEDTTREYEQQDISVVKMLGGTPKWHADQCTACEKCVPACPTESISIFRGLTDAKLNAGPEPLPAVKDETGIPMVLSANPDNCVSCQECVSICENEVGDGGALKMVWDFGEKKKVKARHEYLLQAGTNKFEMNEIIEREALAIDTQTGRDVYLIKFYNPILAEKAVSGLFMIMQSHVDGERIPLTYADWDKVNGTVTMVVQNLGAGSAKIINMQVGQKFTTMVGPLGKITEVPSPPYDPVKDGKVVIMAGGVGLAAAFPVIGAFKDGGNHVVSLLGFRNKDLVWWADESGKNSDELVIMTDDGSAGKKGFVHMGLLDLINSGEKIAEVWVCGPPPMMDAVVKVCRENNLKTTVSLAPHMVDGTGMCGACRVEVDGKLRFACIHGPEFDGLKLNWDVFKARHRQYTTQQEDAKVLMKHEAECVVRPAASRVPMPELPPKIRRQNWEEVAMGYTKEQAMAEAKRCIQCHNPTCVQDQSRPTAGCPVKVDIPGFINQIANGNFIAAADILKRTNAMPAVCGRVCPQEDQCEQSCIFSNEGEVQEPIAIGRLERFAADFARKHAASSLPIYPVPTGKKVAVVGSGPASIAAAGDLAKFGHDVTVHEALHKVGGVLRYGIPDFRLPKEIVDFEFMALERLGVKTKLNFPVGPVAAVPELLKKNGGEFDAVFLGVGAGAPIFLGVPGENSNGVISANEFLTRIILMRAFVPGADTPVLSDDLSKKNNVIVIGAGNTAMDVARSATRMVSKRGGKVSMMYRRSMSESPSREEEIHHAADEGISFIELTKPLAIEADENGWVTGIQCLKMEQLEDRGAVMAGSRDTKRKRRNVKEIAGSEHVVPCDVVIPCIGTSSNEVLTNNFEELALNKKGYILADAGGHTNFEGVFAGGDIVSGAATVIEAAGMGCSAAVYMDEYLRSGVWPTSAPKTQFARLKDPKDMKSASG